MNIETHEEDWAIYFTTINENRIGSVLVDLGLINIAPIESKFNLITITTFMNNRTEDGLSSAEENEFLNEIENNFIDLLGSKYETIYTGRLKYDNKILSYFYAEKISDFENTFAEIKNQYPKYRFEYAIKEENDWRAYFEVLYPSEFEMQVIQNGRVVENLEENGDKLNKERQVDHWIYFNSEPDRENFLNSIKKDNFEIVSKDKTNNEDAPFELQIARIDNVDYESANEYVMYLWQKAQEFNGNYDGWETFIVKD